jgi:hypothetical protein
MFIQGHLQSLFDTLFDKGFIDPLLKMDWQELDREMTAQPDLIQKIILLANDHQKNPDMLVEKLEKLDSRALIYLALEVAREFAEYESRQSIH